MGESPEEIRQQIEQTRAEMSEVVEALASRADVKARAQKKVEETKHQAQERLEKASSRLRELAAKARETTPDEIGTLASEALGAAKKRPVAVTAFAAALLGYFVGRGWRRRPSGAE